MSQSTMRVGIDLGTSNSSVAVAHNGRVDIVRNSIDEQVTPSVVQLHRNGSVIVGRKAYEHFRLRDDGSAFARFKRLMGSSEQYVAASTGKTYTPVDLSAEVLKSLRAEAERFLGEPVTAAVITVPAMFELIQCDATLRAASMAGLTHTPLLQEPIAAGLAYGFDRDLDSGYFLVYDMGGGTFDATLMQVVDGRLDVVGTSGDNYLGGRDWDRRLSGLITQRLMEHDYEFWAPDDPDGREFRARLDIFAEQEKIRLSNLESVDLVFDGELRDASDSPIETSITISRAEYEHLIAADIERSGNVVLGLLAHHGIPAKEVSKLVLVGGPTKTPVLRRLVSSMVGVELETAIDPMTVVAQGAAIFAASQVFEADRPAATGEQEALNVNLVYKPVTDDEVTHVAGRIDHPDPAGWSVEISRDGGGWTSGRTPLQGNTFMMSLLLEQRKPNSFSLRVSDQDGRAVAAEPAQFIITHGLMVSEPPLPRSISVAVRDHEDNVRSHVLIAANTPLPAKQRATFYARVAVSPGDNGDTLDIPVYEGEAERPANNRHVGRLSIAGNRITHPIPKGTPIEVTIKVDASRKLTVSAHVALLDETFDQIITDQILPKDDPWLTRQTLEEQLRRALQFQEVAKREVEKINTKAERITADLESAEGGDEDSSSRAARALKEITDDVDRLETKYAFDIEAERLKRTMRYITNNVNRYGTESDKTQMALYQQQADVAIDSRRRDELEAARDSARNFFWGDVVHRSFPFWVEDFIAKSEYLASLGIQIPEATRIQGQQAIDRQDVTMLRSASWVLHALLPKTSLNSDEGNDTGLDL